MIAIFRPRVKTLLLFLIFLTGIFFNKVTSSLSLKQQYFLTKNIIFRPQKINLWGIKGQLTLKSKESGNFIETEVFINFFNWFLGKNFKVLKVLENLTFEEQKIWNNNKQSIDLKDFVDFLVRVKVKITNSKVLLGKKKFSVKNFYSKGLKNVYLDIPGLIAIQNSKINLINFPGQIGWNLGFLPIKVNQNLNGKIDLTQNFYELHNQNFKIKGNFKKDSWLLKELTIADNYFHGQITPNKIRGKVKLKSPLNLQIFNLPNLSLPQDWQNFKGEIAASLNNQNWLVDWQQGQGFCRKLKINQFEFKNADLKIQNGNRYFSFAEGNLSQDIYGNWNFNLKSWVKYNFPGFLAEVKGFFKGFRDQLTKVDLIWQKESLTYENLLFENLSGRGNFANKSWKLKGSAFYKDRILDFQMDEKLVIKGLLKNFFFEEGLTFCKFIKENNNLIVKAEFLEETVFFQKIKLQPYKVKFIFNPEQKTFFGNMITYNGENISCVWNQENFTIKNNDYKISANKQANFISLLLKKIELFVPSFLDHKDYQLIFKNTKFADLLLDGFLVKKGRIFDGDIVLGQDKNLTLKITRNLIKLDGRLVYINKFLDFDSDGKLLGKGLLNPEKKELALDLDLGYCSIPDNSFWTKIGFNFIQKANLQVVFDGEKLTINQGTIVEAKATYNITGYITKDFVDLTVRDLFKIWKIKGPKENIQVKRVINQQPTNLEVIPTSFLIPPILSKEN